MCEAAALLSVRRTPSTPIVYGCGPLRRVPFALAALVVELNVCATLVVELSVRAWWVA